MDKPNVNVAEFIEPMDRFGERRIVLTGGAFIRHALTANKDRFTRALQKELERELNMPLKSKQAEPLKKFYVGIGPKRITRGWAKATLKEAVNHAVRLCEEDGEEHWVVRIVRVVKPKHAPVVVEKV